MSDTGRVKPKEQPEDFDLLDPEVRECPYHAYRVYRESSPVYKSHENGAYVVTSYDELREALRDPERFSRDTTGYFDREIQSDRYGSWQYKEEIKKLFLEEGWEGWPQASTLNSEPPLHTHFRRLADRSFTASRVKKMEPYVQALVAELVDTFIDDGEVEFVSQFAIPLPMHVIADRLGLPRADLQQVKHWSAVQAEILNAYPRSLEEEIALARDLIAFQHYLAQKLEEKKQAPEEDIISDMAVAETIDGNPLPINLKISVLMSLVIGGNESTTNALSSGMLMLMENREILDAIIADRSLLPNFIEESLRLEAPFQTLARAVRHNTRLGDVELSKGCLLDLRWGAANRDPKHFDRPDEIDLERKNPGRHLTFGTAHHHCIGAPLARQELIASYENMLDRMENIQLAPGKNTFEHYPHNVLRGLKELHLTFDKKTGG